MIVKMKKLTLFIRETNRTQALEALRRLGAVHLKSLKQQQAPDMHDVSTQSEKADMALAILAQYGTARNNHNGLTVAIDTQKRIEEILRLHEGLKGYERDLEKTCRQLEQYRPWGGFNPAEIKLFSEKGIYIDLYKVSEKEYQQIRDRSDTHVMLKEKGCVYLAQIRYKSGEKLPFKSMPVPDISFDSLCRAHTMLEQEIAKINTLLRSEAHMFKTIQAHKAALEKRQRFLKVMHGMREEQGFAYMQGYVPHDRHNELMAFARTYNAGYLLEEPDNPEDVPTLIRNPKWVEIINPVFKFMSTVPGYAEYDISAWFLLFFSLFFAMLIGDAGYGAIFLLVTFIIRKRFKQVPAQPFVLMYVLSLATIIWGTITGTWFGAEAIARLPFLSPLIIQGISSFASDNQNLMIYICFTIGIIHLTLAHVMVGLRILNSIKCLAELGWILVLWALYFIAGMLVIGRPMPEYAVGLLLAGTALLLAFSSPQKNILKGIASALTNIPLKIVSSFADIVSYLRLFAVGYATVVLASTFNDMVMGIGFNSVASGLAAAVILFLGHLLNIVLGFMAVIVHGIRLNMLEFSGQMGMNWSGKEYAPFKE
jgi:V/A-type H+/Na+-transporting ATPase subunit I